MNLSHDVSQSNVWVWVWIVYISVYQDKGVVCFYPCNSMHIYYETMKPVGYRDMIKKNRTIKRRFNIL